MTIRKYQNHEQAIEVAKEAVWLAWNACGGTVGLGYLQDKPTADRDAVWEHAYHGPYIDADYVFGRMMKLSFQVGDNTIEYRDRECRIDYQAWCGKYRTYADLFNAAESAVLPKSQAA